MRIDDGSICVTCVHFEHECEVPCGDDYHCEEFCRNPQNSIREFFYNTNEPIKSCKSSKECKSLKG